MGNSLSIVDKISASSSTITEIRANIFISEQVSPFSDIYTSFKEKKKHSIETDCGTVIIKGTLLTSAHRDIIDVIMSQSYHQTLNGTGAVGCFIRFDGLLSKIFGDSEVDNMRIKLMLDEIQVAAIEYKDKNGVAYSFKIISSFAYNSNMNEYYIELSREYCEFFSDQISVDYRSLTGAILALQGELPRSIVRYFLTYDFDISFTIQEILERLGVFAKGPSLKLKKQIIIASLKDMKYFNISYDPKSEMLLYKYDRAKGPSFIVPAIDVEIIEPIVLLGGDDGSVPTTREERDQARKTLALSDEF